MRITKYLHSCLLIEEGEKSVLVDPGNYTAEGDVLYTEELQQLDAVLITHEHKDHMSVPLLRDLMERFPQISIISNKAVVDVLANEGVVASAEPLDFIEMQEVPHEPILMPSPKNTLFHIFSRITHPGDSLQFTESKSVLALPIQAPWGSMVQALEKAVSLNPKPKLVIPIHDWHWKDEARIRLYEAAEDYLRKNGIAEFRGLEAGESLDILYDTE